MSQSTIDAELESELAAVAASSGCELVHVDFRQGKLQVFLDRPQGVTLEDCQTVSKQVSALLDVTDFGSQRYVLEVSSPGLDRELYKPADYDRFRGRLARVTFWTSEPRAKKTLVARLEGLIPSEAGTEAATRNEISVVDESSGNRYHIPLADVQKAKLEIEL